jgi:hypothetical protein
MIEFLQPDLGFLDLRHPNTIGHFLARAFLTVNLTERAPLLEYLYSVVPYFLILLIPYWHG